MSPIVLQRVTVPAMAAAFIVLASLTCAFPTDRSSEVYVTLTSSNPTILGDSLLLQGTQATLVARAWQRVSPQDSIAIQNVVFHWSSGSSATASVVGQPDNSGQLSGIAPGRTTITAIAVDYQSSKPGTFPLRVSSPFTIDSVRADTASYSPIATFNADATHRTIKYGQLLTFYGVGVRGIFLATLPGTPLIPDTLSFKGEPQGLGQMSFWVPWPAQTGKPVALALGGNVFDTTTITVRRRDIYDINKGTLPVDTAPRSVSLNGSGPLAAYPSVLFFNPALTWEDLPRGDTLGDDWYRFTRTDTAAAITVFMTGQSGNVGQVLLSDSIVYQSATKSHAIGASAWTIGPGEYDCRGRQFLPQQSLPDSLIVTLGTLPRGLHLLTNYGVPGNYGLGILNGYVHDRTTVPDRFTPNNTCTLADLNFSNSARTISVGPPPEFRDSSLTIDNPLAVDWYRFQVGGVLTQAVTIQSRPLPLTAGLDSSAVDLYVLTTDSLKVLGNAIATVPGAQDSLTLLMAPGQYYLVVVDFAGIPTRYSLCMTAGLTCTPPMTPTAPAAPPAALGGFSGARWPLGIGLAPRPTVRRSSAARTRSVPRRAWRHSGNK